MRHFLWISDTNVFFLFPLLRPFTSHNPFTVAYSSNSKLCHILLLMRIAKYPVVFYQNSKAIGSTLSVTLGHFVSHLFYKKPSTHISILIYIFSFSEKQLRTPELLTLSSHVAMIGKVWIQAGPLERLCGPQFTEALPALASLFLDWGCFSHLC